MAACLLLFSCLSATANDCASDWLPLQSGNYWIYRTNSRFATAQHVTTRVLGPYEFEGKVYCQIESPGLNYLLRVDDQGRIFRRQFSNSADELLLDPRNLQQSTLNSPLGFTATSILAESNLTLLRESSVYAKGIGLVSSRTTLAGGSSGGFASDQTLIEAFVNGQLYRLPATQTLSLELASEFRNCAVPCYYVACGLGSPVDPPDANKPCLEARLSATNLPAAASLNVIISAADGSPRHRQSIPLSHPNPTLYVSLPFYSQLSVGQPISLFPQGTYLVTLTALDAEGKPLATTTRFAQQ